MGIRLSSIALRTALVFLLFALPFVAAANFIVGDPVQVYGGQLNVRSSPSLLGSIVTAKSPGAQGYVLSGPTSADGYSWWRIRWTDGLEGYTVEQTGIAGLTKLTISPSTKFSLNALVQVTDTGVNLRSDPTALQAINSPAQGAQGTVIAGPIYAVPSGSSGFHHFWKMSFSSMTGWVAEQYLTTVTGSYPNPPTQISPANGATLSTTTPTFSWTNVGGANLYRLLVQDSSTGADVYDAFVTDITHQITAGPLQSGKNYRWKLQARNSYGWSAFSSAYTFTISVPTTTVPGTPQNLVATAGNQQVSLTWNAPSSNGGAAITGYKIYRGPQIGPVSYLTTVSGTSYLNTGLTNGNTYQYAVSAVNSIGEGSLSTQIAATPYATVTVPSAPTQISPADGSTVSSLTPTLQWNSVSGAERYGLYVRDTVTNHLIVDRTDVMGTSYPFASSMLQSGRLYRWNMQAFNSAGASSFTTAWTFTTPGGSTGTADYGSATWISASSSNYGVANRGDAEINYIVIHVTEGSKQSAINTFTTVQPAGQERSAQYLIGKDGSVTQLVREKDIAWHAGNYAYNEQSIGIEHEGVVSDSALYVSVMAQASADLVKYLAQKYNIPKDRTHILGHNEVPCPCSTSCANALTPYTTDCTGHSHTTNVCAYGGKGHHTDPGQYWNWNDYLSRIGGTSAVVPAVPQLYSPANGAAISTTTPTLTWEDTSSTHQYTIRVEDVATSVLVFNPGGFMSTASISVPSGVLQTGKSYRWQVLASNSAGSSAYSPYATFSIGSGTTIPAVPTALSPGAASAGTIIDTLTPTLQWNSVSGVTYYKVYLSKSPYGASNIVYQNENVQGTSVGASGLVAGTQYRWDVSACNSAGCSATSSDLYFQTQSVGPVCGNTIVETGEQCDDGNTLNGDGCSASCQTEIPGDQTYNTAFITNPQFEHYWSMSADEIRAFLVSKGSYFKTAVTDVDGVSFDAATVISNAAQQYHINPKAILVTMQKESSAITTTTRPSDTTMKFLMGCITPNTARAQLTCAAERYRSYMDSLAANGVTVAGWSVGVAKMTQDGVLVTPANKAIASLFTYNPLVGIQWGGNMPYGGTYLFYRYWIDFSFADDPITPKPCTVTYRTNVVNGQYVDGTWIAVDKDADKDLDGFGYRSSSTRLSTYCKSTYPVLATAPGGAIVRKYSNTYLSVCTSSKAYRYYSADSDATKAVLSISPTAPYTANQQEIATC